jgi:MoaA/NifB/PqqE/SkfB family radical SAM enzyme
MEFTGGDPLTRSDWLETLQKVESLGILFTINSDLTRLKDETIRLLTTFRNLISVQTTLDGASATQHDFYRGSGSFAKTIDGALRLSEAGVPVHAGMIISKENYSSVRKVAELCPKSGIKALYIGSLYAAGRGVNLVNSVPSNDQLGEAARAYCQAIHENIIQPVHPVMYRAVERYLADKKHFNYLKDHPYMVKPGIYDFRVDPKGICYTSIKLEGTSLYNIGDLNNESLSDVWRKSGGINRLRTFCFEQKPNHFRSIDSSPFGGPLALQQAIN